MRQLLYMSAHGILFGFGVFKYALFGKNSIRGHRAMVYFFAGQVDALTTGVIV